MKQTTQQLYTEYRDQMNQLIATYKYSPQKFENIDFAEQFEMEFEKVNTLASFYADLLLLRERKKS